MPVYMLRALLGGVAALSLATVSAAAPSADADLSTLRARVARVLKAWPIVDGHNDLPWEIRERYASRVDLLDLSKSTFDLPHKDGPPLMTDIPRLRVGGVGGQFWSVWIPADMTGPLAVKTTLEEIDIVRRMTAKYPADLEMAVTAADVIRIHKAGKIASLIGIEGGHQIDNSLAVLREMAVLGARYMTLTHTLATAWADSATDAPRHHGLTPYGRAVVLEMNRLGMVVDLSHVSPEVMMQALEVTKAPVMFSHSGARALVDHPRDVPDDVLRAVAKNRGVVMVNFAAGYVSQEVARYDADLAAEHARFNAPPYGGLYIGQPDRAEAALKVWKASHPEPEATLSQVADHAEHIRAVAGIDCVGIGSDFDGIPTAPKGLEGVDRFPDLLVELARRGWSDADLGKIASGNILRVLAENEAVARRLQASEPPSHATLGEATP